MINLASPYSHSDPVVCEQRYRAACQTAAALLQAGHATISPIVHSHPLVEHGLPTEWQSWQQVDRRFLVDCDDVVVLMLDGWRESVGVQAEMRIARELGKPIRFVEPTLTESPGTPTLAHVAAEVAS
jgi:hypothetical protein